MTRSNRENYATLENFKFTGVKAYRGSNPREIHRKFCKSCKPEAGNDIRQCRYDQMYHDSLPSAMQQDEGWRIPKPVWNDGNFGEYGGFTDDFERNRGLEFKGWGNDGGCAGAPGFQPP